MNAKSLALACTLIAAASPMAYAQDAGRATEQAAPRSILPKTENTEPKAAEETVNPTTDSAAANEMTGDNGGQAGPAASLRSAAPVTVGDLGTVEGPVAGTLTEQDGLGYDTWQGSDRASIEAMLTAVPAASPSPTAGLLLRKILLTAAPPPPGRADMSFNALRLTKLIDGGLISDAADLARVVMAPMNPEIRRAQADAVLYAGRDDDACGDVTDYRLDSAEPFWVELRAYCYALANQPGPLELTRSVMQEQGTADPAFLTMLAGVTGGTVSTPDYLPIPDALHVAMMARLKLPMTSALAANNGLASSLIAAGSAPSTRAVRVVAAEKALRAGVLPKATLEQVLDLTTFGPGDLTGAPAIARVEPLMTALARLRSALKSAADEASRAEVVHTAFEIGEREGVLAQIAVLFADEASALSPKPDWGNWSELMIRGLLLAEKPQAAELWYEVINPIGPAGAAAEGQLQLALALASPNPARTRASQLILSDIAVQADPKPPPPIAPDPPPADASAPGDQLFAPATPPPMPPPPPSPEVIARATLDLGLFDALGREMPMEASAAVQPLVMQASAGRRPPPILMQRIDKAALSGSRGEVALSVVTALGVQGAGDLAPDVVVRIVRALQTAGIRDAAHSLAIEAMLLRRAAR
jgi:hypothetical protein